jgi:hypothetical protein
MTYILTIFLSTVLFYIGLKFYTETEKSILKVIELGNIKKNSKQYLWMTSDTNKVSVKIASIGAMFQALAFFSLSVYRLYEIYLK